MESYREPGKSADRLAFEALRHDLYHGAPGKYVLIHHGRLIGIHDTEMEAVNAGHRMLGNVPIFVSEIAMKDKTVMARPGWVYEWESSSAA